MGQGFAKINDVKLLNFSSHNDVNGTLVAFTSLDNIPFSIKRVFTVSSNGEAKRGNHAHLKCSQLIICNSGVCNIYCEDGKSRPIEFRLDTPDKGVLIPPGIWAKQEYLNQQSSIVVLCDREYEEEDYIRNYDDFLNYRHKEIGK